MTLIHQAYREIVDSPHLYMLILNILLNIVSSVLPTYFMSEILNDDLDMSRRYMQYYVMAMFFGQGCDYVAGKLITKFTNSLSINFNRYTVETYNNMDYKSKNRYAVHNFENDSISARYAVSAMVDWGFPTIISVVTSILNAVYVFYKHGLTMILVVFIIINIVGYYTITRKYQRHYTQLRTTTSKARRNITSQINAKLPWLEVGYDAADKIIELQSMIINGEINTQACWSNISNITSLINKLPYLFVFASTQFDVGYFFMIVSIFGQFTSALHCATGFMNQYGTYSLQFSNLEDSFSDKKFVGKPAEKPFPSVLHVKRININNEGMVVRGKAMKIHQGEMILIRGPTGGGKTTFINALFGKIDGITLSRHHPENYYHAVVEFYQNIREKMSTNNISVREHFGQSLNDELIKKCLRLVQLESKILSLDATKPFDVDIAERISGGEKSRLAIATRLFVLFDNIKTKRVFILDEPEQGCDTVNACEVVDSVRKVCLQYKITLIMISHLCDCAMKQHKWNKIFHVNKISDRESQIVLTH